MTALDETSPELTQELWEALGQPGENRPFSCAELTRLLPGMIDTPDRTYCARMIWSDRVYEITYESMSIKGYLPEPYL